LRRAARRRSATDGSGSAMRSVGVEVGPLRSTVAPGPVPEATLGSPSDRSPSGPVAAGRRG
jgi:hypothetical protein